MNAPFPPPEDASADLAARAPATVTGAAPAARASAIRRPALRSGTGRLGAAGQPSGMTSTQAVAVVKRLFAAKKAGHAGTLDPLASGCLPIALGEGTKTVPYIMDGRKTYRFARHLRHREPIRTTAKAGASPRAITAPPMRRSAPLSPASWARSCRCRRPIRR